MVNQIILILTVCLLFCLLFFLYSRLANSKKNNWPLEEPNQNNPDLKVLISSNSDSSDSDSSDSDSSDSDSSDSNSLETPKGHRPPIQSRPATIDKNKLCLALQTEIKAGHFDLTSWQNKYYLKPLELKELLYRIAKKQPIPLQPSDSNLERTTKLLFLRNPIVDQSLIQHLAQQLQVPTEHIEQTIFSWLARETK